MDFAVMVKAVIICMSFLQHHHFRFSAGTSKKVLVGLGIVAGRDPFLLSWSKRRVINQF